MSCSSLNCSETSECKVALLQVPIAYRRRFWMLLLLILSILVNVAQITEFTSLDKTIVTYYGVSDATVSLSSSAYLIFYLLFFFPATIYSEKCGLRHSFVLGSFLNAIGLCVKCFALKPDRFWLIIVAQAFPAIGETLITPSIPSLAATWFKTSEVASVVALAFASSHFGLGLTFIFQGTLFAENSDTKFGLNVLSMMFAAFSVIVFLLTVVTMEDRPPTPPSYAQAKKLEQKRNEYQLKQLFTDLNFINISLASGIVASVNFVVAFAVNQLILTVFPNAYTQVSINGIALAAAYVIGSIVFGATLDRTKRFQSLCNLTYGLSVLSVLLLSFGLLIADKWTIFVSVVLFGMFTGAASSVTMDANIELTYPFPETISISLIYCLSCILPVILSPLSAYLVDIIGAGQTVFFFSLILLPGFYCLLKVKWILKRQTADERCSILF